MRYIEVEYPMDCPYRLPNSKGLRGCGFHGGFVSARKIPCQHDMKFPADCPLEEMCDAIPE